MKTKQKKFIREAADAMHAFTTRINQMRPEELQALIHECDALTQSNCWWLEYHVAPILRHEAQGVLSTSVKASKPA